MTSILDYVASISTNGMIDISLAALDKKDEVFINPNEGFEDLSKIPTPNIKPIVASAARIQSAGNNGLIKIDTSQLAVDIHKNIKNINDYAEPTIPNFMGQEIIFKYVIEAIPKIIDTLIDNIGNQFEIITNVKTFKIEISERSIPHLLALLPLSNIRTTKYDSIVTHLYELIKMKYDTQNKTYLKAIKEVFTEKKDEIISQFINKGIDYPKLDMWNKIAYKTGSLSKLSEIIDIDKINKTEIWEDINNNNYKETYLILLPLDNNGYSSVIIEKQNNSDLFYIKSNLLITNNMHKNLNNYKIEGSTFKKSHINGNILLTVNKYDLLHQEYQQITQDKDKERLLDHYKKYKAQDSTYETAYYDTDSNVNKKINITKLIAAINKLLDKSQNEKDNLLIELVTKYFSIYDKEKDPSSEYYYMLSQICCDDDMIKEFIKQIISQDNIIELRKKVFENKKYEYASSISLDENNKLLYSLKISVDNLNICSINEQSMSSFNQYYEKINNYLKELLNRIESFSISNIKDIYEFLYLLLTYYDLSILFKSDMNNIKAFKYEINDNIITIIKNRYPRIYNSLLEIGYIEETDVATMPVINKISFKTLLLNYIRDNDIETNNNLDELINIIKTNNAITFDFKYLKDFKKEQLDFLLYSIELYSLENIVNNIQNNNIQNISTFETLYNQIVQIRNTELKEMYPAQEKKAS